MNYDLSSVLEVLEWIFVISVCLSGLYLALKRSESPWATFIKLTVTVLVIWGDVWFVRRTISELGEGFAENVVPTFKIVISVAFCGAILAPLWTPHICNLIFNPITNLFDGGNLPPERKPLYSMAIAKRKSGRPLEAVVELRRQLAAFPNDTEGVFLLAAIQAEDLLDLPGAEITINHFCEASTAPKQIAAACTQLADWHLRLGHDVVAACAAWRQIIERFPNSDLAQVAENRIAHAADAEKHLLAIHDHPAIPVPEGATDLGLQGSSAFPTPKENTAAERANAYVQHLAKYPADTDARENLAMIYATDFRRLDLATMEMKQLIDGPNHQSKQTARWLNLLATTQVKLGADELTIRTTLNEIITRFPKSTYAQVAARRMEQLGNELRLLKQTPSMKLGVYDQNEGLKRELPD